MIKKRIIPVLLIKDERIVKSKKFDNFIDVGNPVKNAKIFNDSEADELVILDINEKKDTKRFSEILNKISENCFMPISAGGGINCLEKVDLLFKNGADKVIVNSACYENKNLLKNICAKYGKQSLVISVDIMSDHNKKKIKLFSKNGKKPESVSIDQHIQGCVHAGVGEFLFTSINHDGTKNGPDFQTLQKITKLTTKPIIYCGGIGDFGHIRDIFVKHDVSAVACGTLFCFGDNNPIRAKSFLRNYEINFRKHVK